MNVLRPLLYRQLGFLFGKVKVTMFGEDNQATLLPSPLARSGQRLHLEEWGETYVVSCPYCGDARMRLYINHRWGYFDERTQTRNWQLIKCFNEDCLAEHARRMQLADRVFSLAQFSYGKPDVLLPSMAGPRASCLAELPGRLTPVDQLQPNHPARCYLVERQFDVHELAQEYGVSYCAEAQSRYPLATNRLIIPFHHDQKLVGWQARFLGERPDWSSTPKYYTMPGYKKSQYLYNLDRANQFDHVVVVEGVTDVWRYGPEAVALCGKSASLAQLELLRLAFDQVILLLDGDAAADSKKLKDKLAPHFTQVIRIQLESTTDPGSLSRNELRTIVSRVRKRFAPESGSHAHNSCSFSTTDHSRLPATGA